MADPPLGKWRLAMVAVCDVLLLAIAILAVVPVAVALPNGLGTRPPMGFNDWNEIARRYKPWAAGLNETMVLDVANAMVSTGLRDKGYTFVNLDCGYSTGAKNSKKSLAVDAGRYPSGLKSMGDSLHAMNLSFGIYSSGTQCCDKNVRLGMETLDAAQFAAWGVDYVKYDDCGTTPASFAAMRDAIAATSRPMFYSIHSPWTHSPGSGTKNGPDPATSAALANCWRTTEDITNNFAAVLGRANTNNAFAGLAGPHQWNDPDMLEVGNGLTDAEARSHFSLWCLMKAPLLIGTDLTAASAATVAILGNADAIAINQDALGKQGVRIKTEPPRPHPRPSGPPRPPVPIDYQLWAGPLTDDCVAVLLIDVSAAGKPVHYTANWKDLGIPTGRAMDAYSIWGGKVEKTGVRDMLKLEVQGEHDCAFYKLCPSKP